MTLSRIKRWLHLSLLSLGIASSLCNGSPTRTQSDSATEQLITISESKDPWNAKVIRSLVAAGADVDEFNKYGETPLYVAANEGHAEIVKLLLDGGANPNIAEKKYGWTPLYMAAYGGNTELVKLLLKAGANPNATDIDGMTPLMQATANEYEEIVKLLLDAEADRSARVKYDGKKFTALDIARLNDSTNIVELLTLCEAKE